MGKKSTPLERFAAGFLRGCLAIAREIRRGWRAILREVQRAKVQFQLHQLDRVDAHLDDVLRRERHGLRQLEDIAFDVRRDNLRERQALTARLVNLDAEALQ